MAKRRTDVLKAFAMIVRAWATGNRGKVAVEKDPDQFCICTALCSFGRKEKPVGFENLLNGIIPPNLAEIADIIGEESYKLLHNTQLHLCLYRASNG